MRRRTSCYDGMCGALDCTSCGLSDEELRDYEEDKPEPELKLITVPYRVCVVTRWLEPGDVEIFVAGSSRMDGEAGPGKGPDGSDYWRHKDAMKQAGPLKPGWHGQVEYFDRTVEIEVEVEPGE